MVTFPAQNRLEDIPYEGDVFLGQLTRALAEMRFHSHARKQILRTFDPLRQRLNACPGLRLQERWQHFEQHIWPQWLAGQTACGKMVNRWCAGCSHGPPRPARLGTALPQ